jgi:multicomponent Na+:H+ antiporter subunit A
MLLAILSGFLLALVAPWLYRILGKAAGWALALLPVGLFAYFAGFIGPVAGGETILISTSWIPSLDINLSFNIDGLSLLFALIITGIGALIVIYGGGYLEGDPDLGRFYAYTLMFMASMLGLVLSNNVLSLFVFWELTSITSFLLIGYYHEEEESRFAALQALLVTGLGGLAMLAGLVLLAVIGGSWELTDLFKQGNVVTNHRLYLPVLILMLAGAFTKSAQFPFHFWLPGAMTAPTPVSAYLHSATMVKAGVYLVARISPILGGTAAWLYLVTGFGAATGLLAAYIAWQQTDLKRILAYSTVSALGVLMLLLGLGEHTAVEAAIVFLVVHSLYKGSLFMVAGAVDHESGARDITQLGGLRTAMPITLVVALLAACSMSGFPPFLGFVGKELIYEATLQAGLMPYLMTGAAVLTNALTIVAAGLVVIKPFFGPKVNTPKHAHEAPLSIWLGPLALAGLGLFIALLSSELWPLHFFDEMLVSPAVTAILAEDATVHLALWHGLTPSLMLSLVTIAAGVGLYVAWGLMRRLAASLNAITRWGPEQWYRWALDGMLAVARLQTRVLQSGYLRYYLMITILTTVGLAGYTLVRRGAFGEGRYIWPIDASIYEILLYLTIVAATFMVTLTSSRLAAVAGLGVVGYGVAVIFILFGAPDLAMTQFAIETLSVILLVLVLYKLPSFANLTSTSARWRDLVVALLGGGLMTVLVLVVTALPPASRLTPYFAENSLTMARGHNVVNVILVDFRGFDTMGEITVLSIAALGVYGLLYLRLEQREETEEVEPEVEAQATHSAVEAADLYPTIERQRG